MTLWTAELGVSSLIKKGYAFVSGKRGDEMFALTDEGKNLFKKE